jgi:hypothetical protein
MELLPYSHRNICLDIAFPYSREGGFGSLSLENFYLLEAKADEFL